MEGDNNQSLSLLAELTNFFFKREGVLDSSRFVDFWATMRGSSYVSTLVMKSIIAITGEEKHASLADVVKRLSNGSLSSLPEIRRTDIDSEGMFHLNIKIFTNSHGSSIPTGSKYSCDDVLCDIVL